jgi:hypothetical protein
MGHLQDLTRMRERLLIILSMTCLPLSKEEQRQGQTVHGTIPPDEMREWQEAVAAYHQREADEQRIRNTPPPVPTQPRATLRSIASNAWSSVSRLFKSLGETL